jgi:hypothetical protein
VTVTDTVTTSIMDMSSRGCPWMSLNVVPLAESVDRRYYRLPVTGKFYSVKLPVQLTKNVEHHSSAAAAGALPPQRGRGLPGARP